MHSDLHDLTTIVGVISHEAPCGVRLVLPFSLRWTNLSALVKQDGANGRAKARLAADGGT